MGKRTGMDMIRDAAEAASLHLDRTSHKVWLTIDQNRIEKMTWSAHQLRILVDKRDEDTEAILTPLWKRMLVS